MQTRSCHNSASRKQHTLSGKLLCGECGATFKRKVCNGTAYWVCSRHNNRAKDCGVRQIVENEVYAAFIRLWNTLTVHFSAILTPYHTGLREIIDHSHRDNTKISEINREIAELTKQNHVLSGLRSKGYMDSALFTQQTQVIDAKLAELRRDRRRLIEHDDEDGAISDTQTLCGIFDGAESLTVFDESAFHSVVDKIIVESQERIRFRLTGGLELTETIKKKARPSREKQDNPIRV